MVGRAGSLVNIERQGIEMLIRLFGKVMYRNANTAFLR
jgi:hypothetical protein